MLEHLKGKLSKSKLPDYLYALDVVGLKKSIIERIKEERK